MKKDKKTLKPKEGRLAISQQKECLMPLRIAIASGKMPAIGKGPDKKGKK